MGAASFALVPYANRIADGRFVHSGRQHVLPRNFGVHAHPLHGTGWKRPWSIAEQGADFLEMKLGHAADAHWPWAFSACQRISLHADSVRFELKVTNRAHESAPMGVGFHPAFAACAATALRVRLDGVWRIDADSLPVSLAPASEVLNELPEAVPVRRTQLVDHCFTGWSHDLRIDHAGAAGDYALQLQASTGLDYLQLYMPPERDWFCVEPMSHMPDAINRHGVGQTGLRLLAPGESLQVWMTIAIHDQPANT